MTVATLVLPAVIICNFLGLMVMVMVYMERKISARFQQRFGPTKVGPHGILQLIADTIKLISKEDIQHSQVDRVVFWVAPVAIFVISLMGYAVVPWGPNLIPADLNVGILYILAVTSMTTLAILMAGWGSNSKFTLLGGMRSAAQLASFEIAMLLSILPIILMVGSLSLQSIVAAQHNYWFILVQPVAFLLFLTSSLAETNRVPFDIPEAESELVSGYNTEYSGMKFSFFFFAEYVNMFMGSALLATLFFGGWMGPAVLPPPVWLFTKILFFLFVFMWIRWTLPRVRIDQLMEFGWKVLIPIGFLNLLATAIVLLLVRGSGG